MTSLSFKSEKRPVKYIGTEIKFDEIIKIEKRLIQFNDTIPNDTIYVGYKKDNLPYIYYREIFTPVCVDGTCYPAWVTLYWTPGGGHLGYGIHGFSKGDVLTKYEHTPFEEDDYWRLHRLLNDPDLPLRDYQIENLVDTTVEEMKPGVDAVTRPTKKDIADYGVAGAMYTTYTLWHITYGATQDSIKKISAGQLSSSLLYRLLRSENIADNLFALDHLKEMADYSIDTVLNSAGHYVTADNMILKSKALSLLSSWNVSKGELVQSKLLEIFAVADFYTKLHVIDHLKSYPLLTTAFVDGLINLIVSDRPVIIQRSLQLLTSKTAPGVDAQLKLASLLDRENQLIAKAAYEYLLSIKASHQSIKSKLSKMKHVF